MAVSRITARVIAAAPASTARLGTTTPLGWPVKPALVTVRPRPGIPITVRSGDTATVLCWLAQRWDRYVEPLLAGQCGGYNPRVNVNRPSVWSEHAGGTAIDLNWRLHPNGRRATLAITQAIRAAVEPATRWGVVRIGADYHTVPDPMHVELLHRPDAVADLAAKILADRRSR